MVSTTFLTSGWLSYRVSDSRARGDGFKNLACHCVCLEQDTSLFMVVKVGPSQNNLKFVDIEVLK